MPKGKNKSSPRSKNSQCNLPTKEQVRKMDMLQVLNKQDKLQDRIEKLTADYENKRVSLEERAQNAAIKLIADGEKRAQALLDRAEIDANNIKGQADKDARKVIKDAETEINRLRRETTSFINQCIKSGMKQGEYYNERFVQNGGNGDAPIPDFLG